MEYKYFSDINKTEVTIFINNVNDKMIRGMDKEYIRNKVNSFIDNTLSSMSNEWIKCDICNTFRVMPFHGKESTFIIGRCNPDTCYCGESLNRYRYKYGMQAFKDKVEVVKFVMDLKKDKLDPEVKPYAYFGNISQRKLKIMFSTMVEAFLWKDIATIIRCQSLYGEAFYNAVLRCFNYRENDIYNEETMVSPPRSKIIDEEFRKILIKMEYSGKEIDPIIRERYIEKGR